MALDCESMTVGSIAIVKLNINFNSFNLKYYDLCSFVQRLSSNKYHMLMPFVLERVPFLLIQNVYSLFSIRGDIFLTSSINLLSKSLSSEIIESILSFWNLIKLLISKIK